RWDRDQVVAEAVARTSAETATWLRADLARHLATLVPPDAAADAASLTVLVDELALEAEARCVALVPAEGPTVSRRRDGRPVSEHVTDRRLTTAAVLGQEERLLGWARAAIATGGHGIGAEAAVRVVAGHGRLALVVGPAGAGKTTLLASA